MKKKKRPAGKKTTYMGGEWDPPKRVTPRVFEHFLSRKAIFGVLAILFIFAAAVMVLEVLV